MLSHVWSGGQTGIDSGALFAAKKFGLGTGGWAPKYFKTENGPKPELGRLFGLQEHFSASYSDRTESNVAQTDGTLLIIQNTKSAGTQCTIRAARAKSKPYHCILDPFNCSRASIEKAAKWIQDHQITTLNVAGHRESHYPGIQRRGEEILTEIFRIVRSDLCHLSQGVGI